jgi:hypothetical protein
MSVFLHFRSILFRFYSIFPIQFRLVSLIFHLSVRFWSFFTQLHRHTIASCALVILRTGDNRSDLKRHSRRCLVYIRFRCNSKTRGTNRNIAHHLPTAPKQAERIAFTASTIPIISPTQIFKQLPYLDRFGSDLFATGWFSF